MKKYFHLKSVWMLCMLIMVVVFLVAIPVAHDIIVVPAGLENVEGNARNCFPFSLYGHGWNQRYQQVYAAVDFPEAMIITGIAFRPDAELGGPFNHTLPNVRIDLSTTTRGPRNLPHFWPGPEPESPSLISPAFAANVGADNTTVYSGPLPLSSAFSGPVAGPKMFDIVIQFTTPFFYDPALGNLLIDVRNYVDERLVPPDVSPPHFDAQHMPWWTGEGEPDSVSRLYSYNVEATYSYHDSEGLVTQFRSSVVDTTPPVIVGVPVDMMLEATASWGAVATWELPTASDLVDGDVPVSCQPVSGSIFSLGTTTVLCSAVDAAGNCAQENFTVTVCDTTPPAIKAVTVNPRVLWPPNHKMVPVVVSTVVSDIVDPAPKWQITAVISNEPVQGLGDGDMTPDWEIVGDYTVNLRAERSGKGTGRIYIVTIQSSDAAGNSSTKSVIVLVPHNQRK